MAFGEQVSKIFDWFNETIMGEPVYETDPVGVIDDEPGYTTYPTVDNTARKPEYVERERRSDKVANLNKNYRGHEVKIVEPRSFGDSSQIVKHLLDNRTVVLNLHLLDKERAQRTIDFVSGAMYALDGSMKQVGESVFIFTTKNIQLSVDSRETEFGSEAIWGGNL